MSERYQRLFSLEPNLYTEGSPLVICAGALLKDNESGSIIAQLKLRNISSKTVKYVKVAVQPLDTLNRPFEEEVEYEYIDLICKRNDEFGAKCPIFLNEKARAFSVRVLEVGFNDNSTLVLPNNDWQNLTQPKGLEKYLGDSFAVVEYRRRFGRECNFEPYIYRDIWVCSCGNYNHKGEKCFLCDNDIEEMLAIDKEELRKEGIYSHAKRLSASNVKKNVSVASKYFEQIRGYKDSDAQKERCDKMISEIIENEHEIERKRKEQQERDEAIAAKKVKNLSRIITALALFVCITVLISVIVVTVIIPSKKYNNALELMENGKYGTAILLFEELDGYRDSVKHIIDCHIHLGNYVTVIEDYDVTDFVIPDGVTSIGDYAFSYCRSLTSIVIPDSVARIGNSAFEGCSNLTSVVFSENSQLTSIGDYAFSACSNLTSIVIPDGVTSIGNSAFSVCCSLTSVVFSENSQLTSIGDRAFAGCSNLTSINIPDGVTIIGDRAFSGCPIKSVTIPAIAISSIPKDVLAEVVITSGTSIDENAFSGCSSLTSIEIPESVTSIGNYAFKDCSSLAEVHISSIEAWCNISFNGVYATNPLYYAHNLYLNGELVTELVIPDNITSIGDYAFYNCSSLTSVVFSENSQLTSIGDGAFYGCRSLTSINIPDGVTSIGNFAFKGCSNLTSINIPDGVTSIGNSAFSGCSNLTSINIPDGVTSIGNFAFYGCSSLTSINIPDGVTGIGDYAFYGCSNLTSINIPDGVTSIGDYAFYNCSSLASINIPDGVTSIGDYAFYNCSSLTSINIPDGVTSIGNSAFSGCSNLTSINIPDGVTSIGDWAFHGCSNLTSINIPDGVTSIGYEAFYYCSSLTIYCEAASKPSGWNSNWNSSNRPVVWGYKGEE